MYTGSIPVGASSSPRSFARSAHSRRRTFIAGLAASPLPVVVAAPYREGKVAKVLASGDHGTRGYDEVNAMRRSLIAAGVPARDVVTDHAGFNTRDSMIRARAVFGVRIPITGDGRATLG